MNKLKFSIATLSRAVLKTFLVIAMVTLASLIGVGGAVLWIYGRPVTAQAVNKSETLSARTDLIGNDERVFPVLTPVQTESDSPAQLTPARYVPTDSEIATVSDTPRYTYISYNGGRQQAHLRVNTVLSTSVPAPLVSHAEQALPEQSDDQSSLTDPASHYITNADGRVIGIDGTAGAASEANAQSMAVDRALPVQPKSFEPEVRVAAPVVVRKATPVDDDETAVPQTSGFSVQSELSREDEGIVTRAQPVTRATRSTRPTMFGASDDLRSFGSN